MYIPKWGSNFCFTFPTSEGSDLLSSHVMQTPTFISKLSDGNVIFRLDVGKTLFHVKKFFCSTLSEFEKFLLCGRILINVKTKPQANFKRFGVFKGLVEQKNLVFTHELVK
jgi:hypothetical protein